MNMQISQKVDYKISHVKFSELSRSTQSLDTTDLETFFNALNERLVGE